MNSWQKPLILVCLAVLLLLGGAAGASAENAASSPYPYTAQASFNGSEISGTLSLNEGFSPVEGIRVKCYIFVSDIYLVINHVITDQHFDFTIMVSADYIVIEYFDKNLNQAVAAPTEIFYTREASAYYYSPPAISASYKDGILQVLGGFRQGDTRPYFIIVDGKHTGIVLDASNPRAAVSKQLDDGSHTVSVRNPMTGRSSCTLNVQTGLPPKYTLTARYDGSVLTGTAVHDPSTLEAPSIYVIATFYMGTNYTSTAVDVKSDGTFSLAASGPIDYITVLATSTKTTDRSAITRISSAIEIFVREKNSYDAQTGTVPPDIAPPPSVSLDFTAFYTDGDLALNVTTNDVCELFIDGQATGRAFFSSGEYHFNRTLKNGLHTVTLYSPRNDASVQKSLTVYVPDYDLTAETDYLEISPAHEKALLRVHVRKNEAVDWPDGGITLDVDTADAAILSVSEVTFIEEVSENEQVFLVKLAPSETGVGVVWVTCSPAVDPSVSMSLPVIVHDPDPCVLPASLESLEAEALSGIAATEIQLPGTCAVIGSKAFADCDGLKLVVIGQGLTSIASDAFAGSDGVQVVCPESAADLIFTNTGIQPIIH